MIVYLDSNIVIYLVENVPTWSAKAHARVAALQAAGDALTVSDLTRLECQVGPLVTGDAALLAAFAAFFADPAVTVLGLPASVYDRAAQIRAGFNLKTPDALHLAVAAESGCGLFLTQDARLARFTGIPIEILT